ncbi:hypothetical protein AB0F88_40040 [Streptosporangium sp. NPDC023963]|uniref:hypothetical protein n=1 Tax=Streptosporangium sp. NPDC023963 TaxID=3155608 RepID=UPI003437B840
MHQRTYSLAGVEWTGWSLEDAHPIQSDPQRKNAGFVYIVEFSDGWIKVGHALDARRRLASYPKEAHLRNARVSRAYISKPHKDRWSNEAKMIDFCARNARPTGREYFQGISYERVLRFTEGLPQELATFEEIAENERKAEAFVEGFQRVAWESSRPKDGAVNQWHGNASRYIAELFGRRPDGSYNYGVRSAETDPGTPEAANALWDALCEVADAKGCCLECVLAMSPIDMIEDLLITMVQTEALRLRNHAREHGHSGPNEPMGDAIKRALPADDPRFDTERDPDSDYWDFDPEMGHRRWTKQGDLVEVVEELPPCLS